MAFASLFVPDFPVQALTRLQPELKDHPVVIQEGASILPKVFSANEWARRLGVEIGMTKLQAEGCGELEWQSRSLSQEKMARAALLDCAWAISPRVEEWKYEGEDKWIDTVVLDISGCEKLFGNSEKIAADLKRLAAEVGLTANVAVAGNPEAAVCAARGFSGITIIPEGKEASCIGALPLSSIRLPSEFIDTLTMWGIYTCGQFAALPEIAIVERFGQQGRRWQLLAQGVGSRPLLPKEPPAQYEECMELEFPVDLLEPLLFVFNRLLDQLCARLRMHLLATNELRVALTLQPNNSRKGAAQFYVRTLRLPVPAKEPKFLLKLLQLDLQNHPPSLPVIAVNIYAVSTRERTRQLGLFLPVSPEAERLEITLARLEKTVGEGRVGSAVLLDTHRPNAFEQQRFALPENSMEVSLGERQTKAALRIYRPPLFAKVQLQGGKPIDLVCNGIRRRILALSGPWRTRGDWWSETEWARDEWDVLLHSLRPEYQQNSSESATEETAMYRIYRDLRSKQWYVEGIYD